MTLTIALLAGLWSFQASLRHLLDTPHLYGWNWSVKSGAPALPDLAASLTPAFEQDPTISALAAGTVTQAELGLQRVDVLGLQQDQGAVVAPTVLEGRLPKRPNEMMLGTTTLERAGVRHRRHRRAAAGKHRHRSARGRARGLPGVRRHRAPRQRRVPHVRGVAEGAARSATERVPRAVPERDRRPGQRAASATRARSRTDARHRPPP